MARFIQKTSILFFIVLLCLPVTFMLIGQRQTVSMQEKRALTPLPPWPTGLEELQTFPSRFEKFFNDHFGFRDQLLRLNNYYKVCVLRTSPVGKVIIGRDGWLFFNFNRMIDDYLGLTDYTEPELTRQFNAFCYRVEASRNFHSRYLFVLAPNKQSIYPEHLPSYIYHAAGVTKADQLISRMAAMKVVPFWDLRSVLREAKKTSPDLYLTKDSHWNKRGAFLAYQSIIGQLRKWYPHLPIVKEEQLNIRFGPSDRGNLAEMIGTKEIMPEETCHLRLKTVTAVDDKLLAQYLKKFDHRYSVKYMLPIAKFNPNGQLNVVIFRDSFSTDMVAYFAESFKRMVVFYEPFNADLLKDLVTTGHYQPDLVIDERIEYSL